MDATVILPSLATIIATVASNIALMSWIRSDMKAYEIERRAFNEQIRGLMHDIKKESREFHASLLMTAETKWNLIQQLPPAPMIAPVEKKKPVKKGKAE